MMQRNVSGESGSSRPIQLVCGRWTAGLLIGAAICAMTSGCIGLASNLLYAVKGNERPAEFKGLSEQRVAVICATDNGIGADATSALVTNQIGMLLSSNVKKIKIVKQADVEQWLDSNGWSEADYEEIGKGVQADRVVAVEIMNLRIREGATLYRGQSDITVTVYDVKDEGNILYRKQIPEFAFPQHGGTPVTDTSEAKFRNAYLNIISNKVAGLFYSVDATRDFAMDAKAGSL